MFLLRDDISEIVKLLHDGGVICYPTDTIWGLGCDATNQTAIERISTLKGRPPEKGYVLLVSSIEMLKQHVPKIHPRLETLLAFHQRPVTIVYERNVIGLPAAVRAPNGSAAIRVTKDEFCCELIETFGKPIVSTSANKSGEPFPPIFNNVASEILGSVDYVVKYRQDDKEPGEPSPIARLDRHHELEFIRE